MRAKVSTSLNEPVSATIAVANHFEARKQGDEFLVDLVSAATQPREDSATSTVDRVDGSSTTASASMKGTLQGGRIEITQGPDKMAAEIRDSEISGQFYEALIVEATFPGLEPDSIDFVSEVTLRGVTFRNSSAEVRARGTRLGDEVRIRAFDTVVAQDAELRLDVNTGADVDTITLHSLAYDPGTLGRSDDGRVPNLQGFRH